MDGLRNDQKQASDDKEEDVHEEEGSEEQEVGEHAGPVTPAQPFQG